MDRIFYKFKKTITKKELEMKKKWIYGIVLLLGFFSCKKDNHVSYPYTEHEIVYLGLKSGLTSSSSNQAFSDGLDEVLQAWLASQPNTPNEFIIDGVTYEFTNLQEVTGGVPNFVWDLYWEELEQYSYTIGSCWGFSHIQIPSRRGIGTVYVLYTIVTNTRGEVLFMAVKGNVSPKR